MAFRNVDADPSDPVETWPHEGFCAAIERGFLPDWSKIAREVRANPYGAAAATLSEVLDYIDPSPAAELLGGILSKARSEADAADRAEIAREIAGIVAGSGLSQAEVARRLGTSRTRLSTWVNGRVTPNAATLARIRRAFPAEAAG
ncbi:MAG: helix-turn-helix domain-containing protein [Bifidobacteriaceae bacterium]|nr:helix-turn-helix domain-containing protein [Bifidobacteriaceae bacterium]